MATFSSPIPARAIRRDGAPALVSRSRFRWQGRRLSLDALTGQTGTLTRASALTGVDGLGVTYTAAHSMPRVESRDRDGDGEREACGFRMTTDDLSWPIAYVPGEGTILFSGAEQGTRTTAGAALWYLGNDAQTGARLFVEGSGTYYRATLHDGTTSVTVTGAIAAPTTGQHFDATVQLQESDDGTQLRIRLIMDVLRTEGEDVTDWSAYVTKPATWGAGTAKMRLNRRGSAGTQGDVWVCELADEPEFLTASEMRARL